ncbi:MAG: hypothetical protein JO025_28420 [Verrucomicrobia bacterium]|nr:hypothetical protein [Verrucomicrobiota bacterium]
MIEPLRVLLGIPVNSEFYLCGEAEEALNIGILMGVAFTISNVERERSTGAIGDYSDRN